MSDYELIKEFLDDLKYITTGRNGYFFGLQEDKYDKIMKKWKKRIMEGINNEKV